MKQHTIILALLTIGIISLLAGHTSATAQQCGAVPVGGPAEQKLDAIEENLVLALGRDDVPGLQASAALVLRDVIRCAPGFGFNSSTIPLMRIVKGEQFDHASRIAAALALYELDSNIGDYAIKRTAEFTSDAQMKHICQALAAERAHSDLRD